MMEYILMGLWAYGNVGEEFGSYQPEELVRLMKKRTKEVTVAFFDCDVKLVNDFSNEYVTQQEKLDARAGQFFGVKKAVIDDIYRLLQPLKVRSLIPYPLCIRAFLKSRGVVLDSSGIIFVDDLGNALMITVLVNSVIVSTRQISSEVLERNFDEEITKSVEIIQKYRIKKGIQDQRPFRFVTNNRNCLTQVINQGQVEEGYGVFMDEKACALGALREAEFAIKFQHQEQISKDHFQSTLRNRLKNYLASLVFIVIVVAMIVLPQAVNHYQEGYLVALEREYNRELHLIQKEFASKILSILRVKEFNALDKYYFNLLKQLVRPYELTSFTIINESREVYIKAEVADAQDSYKSGELHLSGLFANAVIKPIMRSQRISYEVYLPIHREGSS